MNTLAINKLLANAPDIDNPIVKALREEVPANAQRRYLDCQLILRGGYAVAGILTNAADEGRDTLQLVAVAQTPDKQVLLAYHYFEPDEVQCIVLGKKMPQQLVQPVRNGGPIILGSH